MKGLLHGVVLLAGMGIILESPGRSKEPNRPKESITATFSIAAVDPDTGICGGAVASKYPAVGKAVVFAREVKKAQSV